MTKDEALRMALDVLQTNYGYSRKSIEALTAIQEALAQPVLKPCHSPYCECTEGKCTHPGCYDARHEPFELPEPTPEQLAALGWQSIECPFCGTSGARAFPKPDCDWEGIAADQAMTIALMKSEQPEQECVAVINVLGNDWRIEYLSLPVGKHRLYAQQYTYTTPPKREWVGLTDADIFEAEFNRPELMTIGEFISNKLKELNT